MLTKILKIMQLRKLELDQCQIQVSHIAKEKKTLEQKHAQLIQQNKEQMHFAKHQMSLIYNNDGYSMAIDQQLRQNMTHQAQLQQDLSIKSQELAGKYNEFKKIEKIVVQLQQEELSKYNAKQQKNMDEISQLLWQHNKDHNQAK